MTTQTPDPRPALASLHRLHKAYGKVQALDGIDLDIHAGELLAKLLAHRADRAQARLGSSPLPTCRHSAHRCRKVRRYLPICTSSPSSSFALSTLRRLT